MRLPANTDLVVLGPFELKVHWYCESKDSQKDDRPIGAASVGQTWGFGDSYEWKLRVSSL